MRGQLIRGIGVDCQVCGGRGLRNGHLVSVKFQLIGRAPHMARPLNGLIRCDRADVGLSDGLSPQVEAGSVQTPPLVFRCRWVLMEVQVDSTS